MTQSDKDKPMFKH